MRAGLGGPAGRPPGGRLGPWGPGVGSEGTGGIARSAREEGLSAVGLRLIPPNLPWRLGGIRRGGALTLKCYCVAIVIKIILCYY